MAASKGALETTCILAPCFQTGNIIGDCWWVDNVETLMKLQFPYVRNNCARVLSASTLNNGGLT